MSRDISGSSYLAANSAALSCPIGFTVACWANVDNATGTLMSTYGGGSYWILVYSGVNIQIYNGTWLVYAAGFGTGRTAHFAGVFRGAGSEAFLDGVLRGTGDAGANASATSGNGMRIGLRPDGADQVDGRIAECGFWAATLNAREVSALAKMVSPVVTRPLALRGYWPLWGAGLPEADLAKKANVAATGTVTAARHLAGSPMAL